MNKKRIFIVVIVTHISIFAVLIFKMIFTPGFDFFIFSDISECDALSSVSENAVVTEYDSPSQDKNLKGLQYLDFFAAEYDSTEIEFEIYAYTFESSDISRKYFEQVTGKDYGYTTNYYSTGSFRRFRTVVIDNENAYFVNISNGTMQELAAILEDVFSVRLTQVNETDE